MVRSEALDMCHVDYVAPVRFHKLPGVKLLVYGLQRGVGLNVRFLCVDDGQVVKYLDADNLVYGHGNRPVSGRYFNIGLWAGGDGFDAAVHRLEQLILNQRLYQVMGSTQVKGIQGEILAAADEDHGKGMFLTKLLHGVDTIYFGHINIYK